MATRASAVSGASLPKTTTQTVRINGIRTKITTRNGKVTTSPSLPLEWELQAAQVRHLRQLPQYGTQFILAADMNAERRGPKARTIALASGMTAGEPDLRIYASGGRLLLIENKVGRGRLSPAQVDRHAALTRLGFRVVVLRATSEEDAIAQVVEAVMSFVVGNDDHGKIGES
jgi:hypothetical protein